MKGHFRHIGQIHSDREKSKELMTQIVILKVDMCIDETIIGELIIEESHVWLFSW